MKLPRSAFRIPTSALLALLVALPARAFELRVLTFNVAGIPVEHGRVPQRSKKIAELIRRDGYDLAGFQECWYHDTAETLGAPFPNTLRYMDGILGGNGLLIATRYPIVGRDIFTYSINAPLHRSIYGEADGIASKGVIVATLKTPEGPLHVFDTHLIAGYPGRNYVPERVGQLYELAAFIRAYAKNEPYILLGDLNLNPQSSEYAILTGLLGVRDACPQCTATDENGRIDHIFLSPAMGNWTVTLGAVVMQETLDAAGRIPLSDHKALTAILRSPERGKPVYSLVSYTGAQAHSWDIGMTRRQALLAIIRNLDRFIQETDDATSINLWIPFYGWSHAKWALRQIDAAQRIEAQALEELRGFPAARARRR